MPLNSIALSGSARLESAASGGPSVKKAPPADDVDAVQRIQRALRELGFPLTSSFIGGQPDGKFGNETEKAVISFQQQVFPGQYNQFDGRVGKNTLAQMDSRLAQDSPDEPEELPPLDVACASDCVTAQPSTSSSTANPPRGWHNLHLFKPTFVG